MTGKELLSSYYVAFALSSSLQCEATTKVSVALLMTRSYYLVVYRVMGLVGLAPTTSGLKGPLSTVELQSRERP